MIPILFLLKYKFLNYLVTEAFYHLQPLLTIQRGEKHPLVQSTIALAKICYLLAQLITWVSKKCYTCLSQNMFCPIRKLLTSIIFGKEKLIVVVAIKWGLKYFFMTTNGWTSRVNHSYVYIHTVHYTDKLQNLQSHLLSSSNHSVFL